MSTRRELVRTLAAGIGGAIGALAIFGIAHGEDAQAPDDQVDQTPDAIDIALSLRGLPYIWGSAAGRSYFGPNPTGFDCSGFVAYVARQVGADVPASTWGAWQATVSTDDPQPGDYAFWFMGSSNPRVQHMAIYLGDDQVVQAGGRRANVNVDSAYAIGNPTFRRLPA